MNMAALPSMRDAAAHVSAGEAVRLQLVADIAKSAFGSLAGRLMAALIIWTAFASVFSLLLGYSRVPYAAARDGNYFRSLAALHPRHNIPHRSLVALGVVAAGFCFFSLDAGHHHAGHHPHPAAILSATRGRHPAPHPTA